ncbi:hypothetical protein MYX82_09130 [Acidobacteria bacterium AH-259-D05]|nr:hypothetical protein [Acidobacteria bacterium AH-259-D05]
MSNGEKQRRHMISSMLTILATILIVLPLSSPSVLGAQQETGNAGRLDLGFDKSVPGDKAFIPMIFTPGEEVAIGKIITEIIFPNELLSFEEARKGVPIQSIDAELSARIKTADENSENSILEVVITSKTEEAIPGGILVYLTFGILPEAPTLHTIKLENRSEAFTVDDPPERVGLTTTNGEIESLDIPILFACLFYMH